MRLFDIEFKSITTTSHTRQKFHLLWYRHILRVTIRPAFGGTVPLFEAISRFFDRKSRFLLQCNRTDLTKFIDVSITSPTKAGRCNAVASLITEPRVRICNRRQKLG